MPNIQADSTLGKLSVAFWVTAMVISVVNSAVKLTQKSPQDSARDTPEMWTTGQSSTTEGFRQRSFVKLSTLKWKAQISSALIDFPIYSTIVAILSVLYSQADVEIATNLVMTKILTIS